MVKLEVLNQILFSSDFERFKEALEQYNIHEQDRYGNNILHYYIKESKKLKLDYKDMIDVILSKGLDINERQSKGTFKRSPLHLAVAMNLESIADYLIDLGADVNSTDANGNSVLLAAVLRYRGQNGYIVEKLIKSGADINKKNNHGISAFSLAQSIDSDVLKFFKQL